MSLPRSDLLETLLELVRQAAREGAAEALAASTTPTPPHATELLDKKTLSRALGVSTSKIDRLCAAGAIPFVQVGDTRRFHLAAVLAALAESTGATASAEAAPRLPPTSAHGVQGVRLLSRGAKK